MRTGTWSLYINIHSNAGGNATFTNMPAADTFLFNSHRHVVLAELNGMTYVRLVVNKQGTAGAAGSKLVLRYSPTFSTSVGAYTDIGASEVSVNIDTTNALLTSGWVEIDPSVLAYDDIYLAVVGTGGNGTQDPQFGNIAVSVI